MDTNTIVFFVILILFLVAVFIFCLEKMFEEVERFFDNL